MVKLSHLTGFDSDLKRQKKQGGSGVSDALKKVMRRPETRTDGRCYMGGERLKENLKAEEFWKPKDMSEKEKKEIARLNKNLEKYNE